MRLALVTALTITTCVLASPTPWPWCMRPSQPCWKVKRAVEAFDGAVSTISARHTSKNLETVHDDDSINFIASAAFDQLSDLVAQVSPPESTVSKHSRSRDGSEHTKGLWCLPGPAKCLPWDSINIDDPTGPPHTNHDNNNKDDTIPRKRWCGRSDVSLGKRCWKDEYKALAQRRKGDEEHEVEKRWCMRPSQPCWKAKRAAESILNAGQEDDESADAEEVAEDGDSGVEARNECGVESSECWRAKRDLNDLYSMARAIVEMF